MSEKFAVSGAVKFLVPVRSWAVGITGIRPRLSCSFPVVVGCNPFLPLFEGRLEVSPFVAFLLFRFLYSDSIIGLLKRTMGFVLVSLLDLLSGIPDTLVSLSESTFVGLGSYFISVSLSPLDKSRLFNRSE